VSVLLTLLDKLFIWLPRVLVIRATEGGVKWRGRLFRKGVKIIKMLPGIHWYWPLTTDYEVTVTARYPTDIGTMSVVTSDGRSVIVSGSVVSWVNDVEAALGERNWDVHATLKEMVQFYIATAIRSRTLDEFLEEWETITTEITDSSKAEMKKFGVHVERVLLSDYDVSRTYRIIGGSGAVVSFVPGGEE
jgi:regulator of protease activity HflC (stomatin/prohibitin superfamily)